MLIYGLGILKTIQENFFLLEVKKFAKQLYFIKCIIKSHLFITIVWKYTRFTINTKVSVYNVYVPSALLYGSESWKICAVQERRLKIFPLSRLIVVSWTKSNAVLISKCGLTTMVTMLRKRRLGHVTQIESPEYFVEST